jgi:hypothetical protein
LQQLHASSRAEVALRIINSDESLLRIIDGYYAVFLHRAPETEPGPLGVVGRDGWLDFLRAGIVPPNQVLNSPFRLQGGLHSLGSVGELFFAEQEYFLAATQAAGA